jgi:3-phenylpropionate/cinnamic acid dioxygenase small subunit
MVERDAVEQLFAQYGWPMDSKEFPVLNEVFTEEASFTVAITGGDTHGPVTGRQAIYDFVSGIVGSQTDQRRHVITNIRIVDDSGDSARVTANLTLIVVDNGALQVKSSGLYDCEVAQENGALRFKSMLLTLDVPF